MVIKSFVFEIVNFFHKCVPLRVETKTFKDKEDSYLDIVLITFICAVHKKKTFFDTIAGCDNLQLDYMHNKAERSIIIKYILP